MAALQPQLTAGLHCPASHGIRDYTSQYPVWLGTTVPSIPPCLGLHFPASCAYRGCCVLSSGQRNVGEPFWFPPGLVQEDPTCVPPPCLSFLPSWDRDTRVLLEASCSRWQPLLGWSHPRRDFPPIGWFVCYCTLLPTSEQGPVARGWRKAVVTYSPRPPGRFQISPRDTP